MNPRKWLVLDANILLRAVFGVRVRKILETYEDVADFYSPDVWLSVGGIKTYSVDGTVRKHHFKEFGLFGRRLPKI